jgi:hypothetical protein
MAVSADIASLNSTLLLGMRDLIVRDPVWAGVKFGMSEAEVARFGALPLDAIQRLASCCDRPLFQLAFDVNDFAKLVSTPAPVAALMVATRPVAPARHVRGVGA